MILMKTKEDIKSKILVWVKVMNYETASKVVESVTNLQGKKVYVTKRHFHTLFSLEADTAWSAGFSKLVIYPLYKVVTGFVIFLKPSHLV